MISDDQVIAKVRAAAEGELAYLDNGAIANVRPRRLAMVGAVGVASRQRKCISQRASHKVARGWHLPHHVRRAVGE